MSKSQDKTIKRRIRSSYITSSISILLVLVMLGSLGLILITYDKLQKHYKENISLDVYIKETTRLVDAEHLKKVLQAEDYIKSAKYVSKEEALKTAMEIVDPNNEFPNLLGYEPIAASIELHLKSEYANQDSIAWIKESIMKNEIVSDFGYNQKYVELIDNTIRNLSIILLGIAGIFVLISFTLINNSIRLSIFSKRFLIRTMQLVGATNQYIRSPFIRSSTVLGIICSFIALLILGGLLYLGFETFPDIYGLYDIHIYASLFTLIIIIGILFSNTAAYFAVRKYLRMKQDDLYKF